VKKLSISITRRTEANEMLTKGKFDAVISIGPFLEFSASPKYILRLGFNDRHPWEMEGLNNLPRAVHVLEICEFAERLPEGANVLIHCGAGHCRSTAAAIVLLACAGWEDKAAVEEVMRIKDGTGKPTGWLLWIADGLLGTRLFQMTALYYRMKWSERLGEDDVG